MIRLRVLGPLDLRDDEGTEYRNVLAQPKRLALLVTLVVGPPGFRRRDSLHALLWPDLDQSHARSALNQAVHFLRRELGGSVGAGIMSRGADEIGIDTSSVWCDAMEFGDHIEAGRFQEALNLYRGNLLEGFFVEQGGTFEQWLERERDLLRAAAAKAARAAVGRHEVGGDLTPAVAAARRAVDLADGDERALRELLQLLDRVGDRAGALQAYQDFARKLQVEYNASPAPETQALMEEIRSRRGTLTGDGRRAATAVVETQPTNHGGGRLAAIQPQDVQQALEPASVNALTDDTAHDRTSLGALLLRRSPWVLAGLAVGTVIGRCAR